MKRHTVLSIAGSVAVALALGGIVRAQTPQSPLNDAVKKGDKAEVEALLAKGANVNARLQDEYGYTPLHMAVSQGRKDIAELLLAAGADVNASTPHGVTPLHLTAYEGTRDIAEYLLAKGAEVNARDLNGDSPLHYAAGGCGSKTIELARKEVALLLLAKGADANAKNNDGLTPLELNLWKHSIKAGDRVRCADIASGLLLSDLLEEHIFRQAHSNPREGVVQLTAHLQDKPDDISARRLVIKLAGELKPSLAIPEEARKYFIEGTAIVKAARNPAQQMLAADSFKEALKIAPWWADAYYNLGVALELAENYDEAEKALMFYLVSNPGEQEKREAQDHIYALNAKRKLKAAN